MPRRAVPLLLSALALLTPASAEAGFVTIGSDLEADATLTESHPRDWGSWSTGLASGTAFVAPDYGEVSTVELKGTARKPTNDAAYGGKYPPFNVVITVLSPNPDGSVTMTSVSGDLWALGNFPFSKPASTISSWNLQDYESRVCVDPGDYVALNTSGGFGNTDPAFGGFPDNYYVDGYPMQFFGRVPGSQTTTFEQPANGADDGNGFQSGDTETGTVQAGRELLMRVTIATERDARATCYSPDLQNYTKDRSRVELPVQATKLKLQPGNQVPVALNCVSLHGCKGQVYLKHEGKPAGVGPFELTSKQSATFPLSVNANGLRLLKLRGGRLKVTAIVRVNGGKAVQRDFKLVR